MMGFRGQGHRKHFIKMHFASRIADSPTFGNIRSNVKVVNGPDVRGQRSHDMMTAPRQVTFRLSWLENAYFFTPTIFFRRAILTR